MYKQETNLQKEFSFGKVGKYAGVTAVFLIGFFASSLVQKVDFFKNSLSFLNSTTTNAQAVSTSSNSLFSIFQNSTVDAGLYDKVYNLLEEKQIKAKEIKQEDKIYGSIKGLVASYGDPYTTFFPPVETTEFKSTVAGAFEGVGMEVGIKDNLLTVIAPLKNSPAEKAGIKADDRILKINASSTENMSTDQAVKLIRGAKGTPVTLNIFRISEKTQKDITIIREKIDIPTVATKLIGNTFVLSLYSFNESSPQKFQEAITEFANSRMKNLVLDLRNNPGGYLEASVLMASFFTEKGQNIVTEEFTRTGVKNTHSSNGFGLIATDTKMVVLVNKGSASASEILAGALQDYDKAKIVGEKSFGKGSVQEYMDLGGGTSIKITVAKWLTPKGNSISENGVTPDIIIPFKENLKNKKADNQLDTAIKVLNNWNFYQKYKASDKASLDLGKVATSTKK
jgi:carboxyl-terminal processing protease